MNRIYYFSGSGKSFRLAKYFSDKLNIPMYDISDVSSENIESETALVVFPVYCQNIPDPVADFIPKIKAQKIAFAAVYGMKSYGNVISDASKLTNAVINAAVCVPSGHSFLGEEDYFDFNALSPFIEKLKSEIPADITENRKDFYADLIPARRTRIGVKLIRSKKCVHCGKCIETCPMNAINYDKISNNCIRCLRCVRECPENAISFKTLWFMNLYLKSGRKNELKFYL